MEGNYSASHIRMMGYDPMKLALKWFQMSNDAFFSIYGFSWVPTEPLYTMAKRQLDKEFADRMNRQLFGN